MINSLQKLMDTMTSFITATFNPVGQVIAMWTVMCEDGTIMPVLAPFNDDDEKNMCAFVVKKLIKEHNGYMLGFLSETWVVSTDDDPNIKSGVVPSEHPKRREGIFFLVEDKFGKSMSGFMAITRDEDGAGILGKFKQGDFDKIEGRFAEMFGAAETVN